MRPDIMPISSFQALNVAGLLTTSATMRAPCTGGLEYIARAMRFNWESTLEAAPFGDYSAASGEIVGMLKAMKDEMDK